MRSDATRRREMATLLRLRREARKGNKRAQAALNARTQRAVQRANRMLDTLQRHGYENMAYASAMNFIHSAFGANVNRFDSRITDPNAQYQQLIAIEHFLSLKSSTLAGRRRIDDLRVAGFRARFADQTRGMSRRQILNFFDFLAEESIDAYLSEAAQYGSGDEVDSFLYALNSEHRQLSEIQRAIELYQEHEAHPPSNEEERFYYDDLINYLDGVIDVKFGKDKTFKVEYRGENARSERRKQKRRQGKGYYS